MFANFLACIKKFLVQVESVFSQMLLLVRTVNRVLNENERASNASTV